MGVKRKSQSLFKKLSLPVSYKLLGEKLYDARNIFDNKGVTETRHGLQRYNDTSIGGAVLSLSYFKTASLDRYRLAKVGTALYNVANTGAHTSVKSSLTSTTKHRGVTLNDRHILAIESDGLFSYNGSIFTQLGQSPPATGTVAAAAGGSLVTTNVYQVGLTFESSATGFESNAFHSEQVTVTAPNTQIDVSDIPGTAANGTIDKVNIYLKNVTAASAYLFVAQIDLGTTTYSITEPPTSTLTPPTTHAPPLSGGGKYLTVFGKKLAYAGNATYPNDVFVSEDNLPDAFDDTETQVVLNIPGHGPVTGIATGLYNNSVLNPFLVIFKKTSTTVYTEIGDIPTQITIDDHIGCVSNETIKIHNGVVYFMSENGWYAISNGHIIKNDLGLPASLGNGDIDDIFSRTGWTYELNSSEFANMFSAYYSTLGHYMTFVAEGSNSNLYKCYTYEERIGGFRPFEFKCNFKCAADGEDDSGYQTVFLGDDVGYLFTYSTRNSRHDDDEDASEQTIDVFMLLPHIQPDDHSRTYNWKEITVRAMNSDNAVNLKIFSSFSLMTPVDYSLGFPTANLSFTLDVSQLDVGVFGDERIPVTARASINTTGEVLLVGYYQSILNANIGLISSQVNFNANGNANT